MWPSIGALSCSHAAEHPDKPDKGATACDGVAGLTHDVCLKHDCNGRSISQICGKACLTCPGTGHGCLAILDVLRVQRLG